MLAMNLGSAPAPVDDDPDKRVVNEFCHLLEKSKQLFNGLRDLPQYGHKQWQGYFGRTFDVYTKLWKFQQQHRYVRTRPREGDDLDGDFLRRQKIHLLPSIW
jgi:hypothetical protein